MYVHVHFNYGDCFSCSCQPHWAASYLPSWHPLLCLWLHSCNQSKRGHSQQRNMLKNKQHDDGICCRNAAAADVAAAVGQSTAAIRNQSKCQRAKQTSRIDTHTHTRICRSLCVCVCARTPYIKPCSKDFQFIFTKTFFCCRLRFVPPSCSLALSLALVSVSLLLLLQWPTKIKHCPSNMAYAQRGELIEMAQQLQRELIATCVSN